MHKATAQAMISGFIVRLMVAVVFGILVSSVDVMTTDDQQLQCASQALNISHPLANT